jgi:hypothetical protein
MTRRPAFDPTGLDESLGTIPPVPASQSRTGSLAHSRNDAAPVVVAVRVPRSLYTEVIRRLSDAAEAHPSYAQLVAWTCDDRADEVVTRLLEALRPSGRTPRGRRPASDSVPLTLRFRADELAALGRVIRQGQTAGLRVTRTAAVAAALYVWTLADGPAQRRVPLAQPASAGAPGAEP